MFMPCGLLAAHVREQDGTRYVVCFSHKRFHGRLPFRVHELW